VTVTGADLQEMSGTVSIEAKDLVFSSAQTVMDAESMSLSASVKEKNTVSFQMDLTSGIGVLAASGSARNLPDQPQMDVTADLTTDLAAVSRISPDLPDLGGTVHVVLSGRGPVNDPSVQLRITGQRLAMAPDIQGGTLAVAANLADRVLTLETGQADLMGITTVFSGSTDLSQVFPDGFLHPAHDVDQLTYSLTFDQTGGDLNRLSPWIPGFSGKFSSRGSGPGRVCGDPVRRVRSVRCFQRVQAGPGGYRPAGSHCSGGRRYRFPCADPGSPDRGYLSGTGAGIRHISFDRSDGGYGGHGVFR
jgi:hypothetical protein